MKTLSVSEELVTQNVPAKISLYNKKQKSTELNSTELN